MDEHECWVKGNNQKRPHIASYHLYELSRIGSRLVVAEGWEWGGVGERSEDS